MITNVPIGGSIIVEAANATEAFAEARRQAIEFGRRNAESSDPNTAARGRAGVAMLPAFFSWLETEVAASKPSVTCVGFASVLGAMLANMANSCVGDDTRVEWLEAVGTLAIRMAHEQARRSGL